MSKLRNGVCKLCSQSISKQEIRKHLQENHKLQLQKSSHIPFNIKPVKGDSKGSTEDINYQQQKNEVILREVQYLRYIKEYRDVMKTYPTCSKYILLQIQAIDNVYSEIYWSYMLCRADLDLLDLDDYLRDTWFDTSRYSTFCFSTARNPLSEDDELYKFFHLQSFNPGSSLDYIYGIESSIVLRIQVIEEFDRFPLKKNIYPDLLVLATTEFNHRRCQRCSHRSGAVFRENINGIICDSCMNTIETNVLQCL